MGPFVGAAVILKSGVTQPDPHTTPPTVLAAYRASEAAAVQAPFIGIAVGLGLLAPSAQAAAPAHWSVDPAASKLGFQGRMNGDVFNGDAERFEKRDVLRMKASGIAADDNLAQLVDGRPLQRAVFERL